MSNALAVGSVSFVLVDLLNNGLIDRDIGSSIGEVTVSALAPDRVDDQRNAKSTLNLFLYNVTPNEGWRNVNYPSRNAAGERINNPPLALNLHYLLTAYGAEQFHAEILLGYAMQLFHETPVLPRDAIRRSLAAPSEVVAGGGLPGSLLNLFTSDLADQVELIKIWPQTLTTEEISRLWTAFQAKYRPTAAYQVSVVLIESEASTKQALPVQSRTVTVTPFQRPIIQQILSQTSANAPALDQPVFVDSILVLKGNQLQAEATSVLFGSVEAIPTGITASQIIVPLPAGLQAGAQSVQVIQSLLLGSPSVPHRTIESDPATFVLQPRLVNSQVLKLQGTGSALRSGDLQVDLDIAVAANQTVLLMLNQLVPPGSPPASPAAYTFPAPPRISLESPPAVPPPPTSQLTIPFSGVIAGDYLIRVQVDGAATPLKQGVDGRYNGPMETIS
jgi:hypothetical protein